MRHLDFISQFTTDIRHISGNDNSVADALSRVDIQALNQLPPIIDFRAMADGQATDPELSQSSTSSLKLEKIPVQGTDITLFCDTSTGSSHPFVPKQFRYQVFEQLHLLAHPGIPASQRLATSHYVRPNINIDVCKWTHCCLSCQRAKVHKHTVTPLCHT